jgi:hypothetical protein
MKSGYNIEWTSEAERNLSAIFNYLPSPAKFAISCSHTRTILQTARQENSGKSTASILYRKIYKMPYPIFAAIILPLPTHAQGSNPTMLSNTRYLYDYKPLLTVEPAEPAAQGIILIKTANAVLLICPYLKILYFCR